MTASRPCLIYLLLLASIFFIAPTFIFYHRTARLSFNSNTLLPNCRIFDEGHLTSPAPPRKLHLLVPINKAWAEKSALFCKELLSFLVHGYEPTILNWDAPPGDVGVLQRLKVTGVHEYLTNLTNVDDDLVLMMDGGDIWMQLSPETLIQRFETLNATGVVIGADKNCWPNPYESYACRNVSESSLPKGSYGVAPEIEGPGQATTRPRWANSGTIIGTVSAMRALYNDLVVIFKEITGGTDQGVFNELLADRRVSLDYRSSLFWATAYADPVESASFINTPGHPSDPLVPHGLYPPMLHLLQTGEVPAAIHFNSHTEKALMDDWWGKLWWNSLGSDERFKDIVRSRLQIARVRFWPQGDVRDWREVCGGRLEDVDRLLSPREAGEGRN